MRRLRRIVTYQGSIQLVTARAVLAYRERGEAPAAYEDTIVLYDLFAPGGQDAAFAAFIGRLAGRLWGPRATVYLPPDDLTGLVRAWRPPGIQRTRRRLCERIGADDCDEIYLCRDWQLGNLLLLNAFESARKICYGDGIGIYFSKRAPAFTPAAPRRGALERTVRSLIGAVRRRWDPEPTLHDVTFDVGYLFMPGILGETPPMRTERPPVALLRETIEKLRGASNPQLVRRVREAVRVGPVFVLLTSNFSEAGKMMPADELCGYREFLEARGAGRDATIVVKPHPRDGAGKIRALEGILSIARAIRSSAVFSLNDEVAHGGFHPLARYRHAAAEGSSRP